MPSTAAAPRSGSPGGQTGYTVRLDVFEGPLDLLLHLIRREEMDIYDIPIARITEQYLEYLGGLAFLDLDRASEFLVLAVALMDIKSRMLLPRPAGGDFIDAEAQTDDPRRELTARLLEYKRYKEAAVVLADRARLARRAHSRYGGPGGALAATLAEDLVVAGRPAESGAPEVGGGLPAVGGAGTSRPGLPLLVAALWDVLRELEGREPAVIERESVTVADKVREMTSLLLDAGEKGLDFVGLLHRAGTRRAAVVTFLALLELLRQGRVRCAQKRPFGPLTVWASAGLAKGGRCD